MDNHGTVDNPAWISTVFFALMRAEHSPPSPTLSRGLPFGKWGLFIVRHSAHPFVYL